MNKFIEIDKYNCGMSLYTAPRKNWTCELAGDVFDESFDGRKKKMVQAIPDEAIVDFLKVIKSYPIEDLTSGQAYHDKQEKLIAIVVKPIKTTFISSYYTKSSEGTTLFPGYKEEYHDEDY